MQIHGLELSARASRQFYRIVRADNCVVTRSGRRGTEGRVSVRYFGTLLEGVRYWEDQADTMRGYGYSENYQVFLAVTDEDCEEFRADPLRAEQAFVASWVGLLDEVFAMGEATWVVMDSLLLRSKGDPFHAALLARILERPHSIDRCSGRILGQIPNLRAWDTVRDRVHSLVLLEVVGSVSGDETRAEIDKVRSLYNSHHPEPERLFSVVRRASSLAVAT